MDSRRSQPLVTLPVRPLRREDRRIVTSSHSGPDASVRESQCRTEFLPLLVGIAGPWFPRRSLHFTAGAALVSRANKLNGNCLATRCNAVAATVAPFTRTDLFIVGI